MPAVLQPDRGRTLCDLPRPEARRRTSSAWSSRRATWQCSNGRAPSAGCITCCSGRLAPLDNIGPEQLTLDALLRRVQQGGVKEVILATSPTLEGDGTALYVSHLLAGDGGDDHAAGTRFAVRIGRWSSPTPRCSPTPWKADGAF